MLDHRIVAAAGLGLIAHLALAPAAYSRPAVALALLLALVPILITAWAARGGAPRDLRPAVVVLLLSLPLSLWASPLPWAVSWARATTLAWALGLALLVAGWDDQVRLFGRAAGRCLWLAAYLVLGMAAAANPLRLPQNELAGTLVLFVPLGLALMLHAARDPTAGPARRLALALASTLPLAALLHGGSRGGLLALAAGLLAMAILAARGRRRWLLVAGVAAAAAALVLVPSPARDFILFGGSPQGWSWGLALSGRPEIWQRGLAVLAATPLTGIGLGTFGRVTAELYPLSFAPGLVVEDAHQLFLQTALDLGPAGLLAFAAIVVGAAGRLLAVLRHARGLLRARALGLGGALVAHLAFGLADAVALGGAGNVAFWFLVGLIFATPQPAPAARRRWPRRLGGALALVAALLLASPPGRRTAALNLAALDAMEAVLDQPAQLPAARDALYALEPRPCRASWLLAQVLARQGDARRDAAFADSLRCAATVPLAAAALTDDRRLAQLAVRSHPGVAVAHRWLARSYGRDPPPEERRAAIASYRHAVALAPRDGRAWYELGKLLAAGDLHAALRAFLAACEHGDPGANACVAAAETALALGDRRAAIRYYRLSRWPEAHRRAARLQGAPE
ncbi:MAG: hypothetical protein D6696_19540 [Acidobacteria bacterium]|nr:MAG: hypothetical protein D6696_19540 [Acidobacteriota bacterium]